MRHHYVPQFLLSPWAKNTPDKKFEVFRLDLPHLPSSRHPPKYTGFVDDLYALTEEVVAGMERQAIEKLFLRRIDNSGARVRRKLENQGLESLTEEDKVDWTRFLMSLRFRQPNIVHEIQQKSAHRLKAILKDRQEDYEELIIDGASPTLEEWTEKQFPGLIENFGLSFFHKLVDNSYYGNKILRMKWGIWDFQEVQYDLLLSDHPCIFTSGIDETNCVIALPISPKKAFLATQSNNTAETIREQGPKDIAMLLNESSVLQASVRIYARNESPARRFIKNRIHLRSLTA